MFDYYWATEKDIPLLVQTRVAFLKEMSSKENFGADEKEIQWYFEDALKKDECCCLFVKNGEKTVGTGIVFFYRSVPSLENRKGRNGYITSMYVDPNYRRQGVATQILERLCAKAKSKDCKVVSLSPSEMGKGLYESFGFQTINDLMRKTL